MIKVLKTIKLIKKQVKDYIVPSVTQISRKHDPYQVLIFGASLMVNWGVLRLFFPFIKTFPLGVCSLPAGLV